MTVVCTSCGLSIPPSMSFYKCRQCTHHFVCQACETKHYNRTSSSSHTLDRISVPQVQTTTVVDANIQSVPTYDARQHHPPKPSSKPPSIFNSDGYLYGLFGCCSHCYRIITMDKEPSFQCQQCPTTFTVCTECMPLMSTHHPSIHTFSKQPLSHWTNIVHELYHLDVRCDGCSREGFTGKRYQCKECSPSYDLCENCFGQKHTHHKVKYIQNPCLHSFNQQALGLRTVELGKRNGAYNADWRDPLTGWTKSDGELVIQKGKQEQQDYEARLQLIRKRNEEHAEEEYRIARQKLADSERRLLGTKQDGNCRMAWDMTLR